LKEGKLMAKKTPIEQAKMPYMDEFLRVAGELGYKVTVTGGNFITHEFHGDMDEFQAVLALAKGH
jgi:hypothetical protein